MKPAVEVSITSWKKNVVKPGQEYGRVLLMPGTGYNCDRPLLYWSAQALVEAGWRIDRMNVRNASDDLSTVIPVLNQAIDGWVAAARESGAGKAGDSGDGVAADDSATVLADGAAGSPNRDSDTPSGPRLLLIGKSLTTMTYPHVASHYGLPFVLLTPVLHHADFDPSARVIPVPAVGDDIVAESETPSVAEARAIIRAEQAGQSHAASSRYSGPLQLRHPGPQGQHLIVRAQPDVDFDGLHALPSCLSNPTLHSGAAGPLCGPPPSPLLGKSIPI